MLNLSADSTLRQSAPDSFEAFSLSAWKTVNSPEGCSFRCVLAFMAG
jgi:hypothetical protein